MKIASDQRKSQTLEDLARAGTGSMMTMIESISAIEKRGYWEHFVPKYDHLSYHTGGSHLLSRSNHSR